MEARSALRLTLASPLATGRRGCIWIESDGNDFDPRYELIDHLVEISEP